MSIRIPLYLLSLSLVGCYQMPSEGNVIHIKCYSGGQITYEGYATSFAVNDHGGYVKIKENSNANSTIISQGCVIREEAKKTNK